MQKVQRMHAPDLSTQLAAELVALHVPLVGPRFAQGERAFHLGRHEELRDRRPRSSESLAPHREVPNPGDPEPRSAVGFHGRKGLRGLKESFP